MDKIKKKKRKKKKRGLLGTGSYVHRNHEDYYGGNLLSTETMRLIRDGEHRTANSTFTYLLSARQGG